MLPLQDWQGIYFDISYSMIRGWLHPLQEWLAREEEVCESGILAMTVQEHCSNRFCSLVVDVETMQAIRLVRLANAPRSPREGERARLGRVAVGLPFDLHRWALTCSGEPAEEGTSTLELGQRPPNVHMMTHLDSSVGY